MDKNTRTLSQRMRITYKMLSFNLLFKYFGERTRRVQRGEGTEDLKWAPVLTAQSPTRGSKFRTVRALPELKPQVGRLTN